MKSEPLPLNGKFKVLIVDDVPENIQVLVHLLTEKGLRVQYADSGIKALNAINKNLPDLILLDVSMPGMDGFEVCEKLKNDPVTQHIPVIFLTAKVDQQDVISGLEKGAVDYITKPFNSQELTKRVFTHLELKHNRDIINRQNEELRKLNEVKNQLFSVISHDMKNLFNNILFGTESLEKEIEHFKKDEVAQMAGLVNDSAKRAFDLLQNLLTWARSQMDSIQFIPAVFDVRLIANQAISLFRPSAVKKNIIINIIADSDESLYAFADVEMIKTVVRNMLSNAIKYSNTHSQIEVRLSKNSKFIQLDVQDYGIGMTAEKIGQLKKINRPSGSVPGTQNEKGSGLGVLLIKDFVAKNQGVLSIDSQAGKGSVFSVSLPIAKDFGIY